MHPKRTISRLVALTLGAILASSPLSATEEAPPGAAAGEAERLRAELLAKMAEINARQKQLQEQMQAADQRRRELELIIGREDDAGQQGSGQQGAGQDRKPAPAVVAAERKAEQDSQRDKPPELPRVSADVGGVLTPRGHLVVEPSFQYIYSSVQRVSIDGYTVVPILIGRLQVVEAGPGATDTCDGLAVGLNPLRSRQGSKTSVRVTCWAGAVPALWTTMV